jgi:hypothetical protein
MVRTRAVVWSVSGGAVEVYDRSGRVVQAVTVPPGAAGVVWDARSLVPGVYFLRPAGDAAARPAKAVVVR